LFVILCGMLFRVGVTAVGGPAAPEHVELALTHAVMDKIVPHVHGFGPALLNAIVSNAAGGGIVRDHWGGWLGMPELIPSDAFRHGLFAIVEEARQFSFGGTTNNLAKGFGRDVDKAVELGLRFIRTRGLSRFTWLGAQVVVPCVAGMSFALDIEDHVALGETDNGVGVRSTVVE
jgi:hypothetical protein